MKDNAIVLLSGGQDSTTSLFWAKKIFKNVEAVSFEYGQRHKIELRSSKVIAQIAGVKHKIFKIKEFNQIKNSALLDKKILVTQRDKINKNLPASFVPGRNILFLTVASSYAYTKNIKNLVVGVSQTDYSGYPDCRYNFIKAMEKALSQGLDYKIKIHTPLINKSKKEIVIFAKKLGIIEILKWTHTCYEGKRPGCGKCSACILREKGFREAGIKDPLFNL